MGVSAHLAVSFGVDPNTKAANQVGLRKFGGTLAEALRQQGRSQSSIFCMTCQVAVS
jgi:hypothetical protein